MKQIQFTSGCPNNCDYCHEPKEVKRIFPYDYKLMGEEKEIQILDMNFLANPDHLMLLRTMPDSKYELICGVDYRRLTQEICNLLKKRGFIKIRWAWDYGFSQQSKHKKVYKMFLKAGYKPKELSVFVLVNWKTPFVDCMRKLQLFKVWGVNVSDCCFDGGYKMAKPHHWSLEHIKRLRKRSLKSSNRQTYLIKKVRICLLIYCKIQTEEIWTKILNQRCNLQNMIRSVWNLQEQEIIKISKHHINTNNDRKVKNNEKNNNNNIRNSDFSVFMFRYV
jgi:hypothetical protein